MQGLQRKDIRSYNNKQAGNFTMQSQAVQAVNFRMQLQAVEAVQGGRQLQNAVASSAGSQFADCVVVGGEAAWDCGGCCGAAAAGGLYENSKPLRGLEFLAARSICTCCSVEGAPSALMCLRAAAGVKFLPLGVRFLLANPHHMTKTATTNSNVEAALPASQLLKVEIL